MAQNLEALSAKFRFVEKALADTYGRVTWQRHLPPVDELVATILSQATSDTNRDKGYLALKERFPEWDAAMNAPAEEVVQAIRPAGLANQKGPRIQEALRFIYDQRGALELDFLADIPLPLAKAWLTRINGVGPKTAAILLLFTFNRPAFPVDTHVHRIMRRLGLIGQNVSADKAHDILESLGDPEGYYSFHLNLIRHGREVCTSRTPRCADCPLRRVCDHFQIQVAGQSPSLESGVA